MRKLGAVVVVVALGLLVVPAAACSSESDDDPTAEPSDTTRDTGDDGDGDGGTGDGSGEQDAGGDGDGEGEDGEEGDREDVEVLASATAQLPANPNDDTLVPLRLDVVALERLDGMVELRLALTNEGDEGTPTFEPFDIFDDPRLTPPDGLYSVSGASLVDIRDDTAYLTIIDSEGTCLCTGRLDRMAVAPGETLDLNADFAGVPDDLDDIDVQVPGFPTIDAVALG